MEFVESMVVVQIKAGEEILAFAGLVYHVTENQKNENKWKTIKPSAHIAATGLKSFFL